MTEEHASKPQFYDAEAEGALQRPRGDSRALIAAMTLGVLGGTAGVITALTALIFAGSAITETDGAAIALLAFFAALFGAVGVIGGAVVRTRPFAGWVAMLVAAAGGGLLLAFGWLFAGTLLAVGAICGRIGQRAGV